MEMNHNLFEFQPNDSKSSATATDKVNGSTTLMPPTTSAAGMSKRRGSTTLSLSGMDIMATTSQEQRLMNNSAIQQGHFQHHQSMPMSQGGILMTPVLTSSTMAPTMTPVLTSSTMNPIPINNNNNNNNMIFSPSISVGTIPQGILMGSPVPVNAVPNQMPMGIIFQHPNPQFISTPPHTHGQIYHVNQFAPPPGHHMLPMRVNSTPPFQTPHQQHQHQQSLLGMGLLQGNGMHVVVGGQHTPPTPTGPVPIMQPGQQQSFQDAIASYDQQVMMMEAMKQQQQQQQQQQHGDNAMATPSPTNDLNTTNNSTNSLLSASVSSPITMPIDNNQQQPPAGSVSPAITNSAMHGGAMGTGTPQISQGRMHTPSASPATPLTNTIRPLHQSLSTSLPVMGGMGIPLLPTSDQPNIMQMHPHVTPMHPHNHHNVGPVSMSMPASTFSMDVFKIQERMNSLQLHPTPTPPPTGNMEGVLGESGLEGDIEFDPEKLVLYLEEAEDMLGPLVVPNTQQQNALVGSLEMQDGGSVLEQVMMGVKRSRAPSVGNPSRPAETLKKQKDIEGLTQASLLNLGGGQKMGADGSLSALLEEAHRNDDGLDSNDLAEFLSMTAGFSSSSPPTAMAHSDETLQQLSSAGAALPHSPALTNPPTPAPANPPTPSINARQTPTLSASMNIPRPFSPAQGPPTFQQQQQQAQMMLMHIKQQQQQQQHQVRPGTPQSPIVRTGTPVSYPTDSTCSTPTSSTRPIAIPASFKRPSTPQTASSPIFNQHLSNFPARPSSTPPTSTNTFQSDEENTSMIPLQSPSSVGTFKFPLPSTKPKGDGKIYKCPKPLCSKSYKNLNGLKYHLSEGKCEFEAVASSNVSENNKGATVVAVVDGVLEKDEAGHGHGAGGGDEEMMMMMMGQEGEGTGAAGMGEIKVVNRPYYCRVPGCLKKYKNLNGLKYHARICHVGLDFKQDVKGYGGRESAAASEVVEEGLVA
ncbi:Transcriptional regulator of ribosomal biogenesis proteins [Chytridiales sp. JEL 0842]|nr:Transcriptional regulator of ribosomal biogenesis proteins [Chytridiales sp. JEL 0842]